METDVGLAPPEHAAVRPRAVTQTCRGGREQAPPGGWRGCVGRVRALGDVGIGAQNGCCHVALSPSRQAVCPQGHSAWSGRAVDSPRPLGLCDLPPPR